MELDFHELFTQAFASCSPFFRDTTLPSDIIEKYRIGLILREPTFCDATHKLGGFVAPHRFLIISGNAKCLDGIAPQPWGLCAWMPGRVLKVIDIIGLEDRQQVTLLEIPEEFLTVFCAPELNPLEIEFVAQARDTFEEACRLEPLPELDTPDWRERLVDPIGIDDTGHFFSLYPIENLKSPPEQAKAVKVLNYLAGHHLQVGDLGEVAPCLTEAIQLARALGEESIRDLAHALLMFGRLRADTGDPRGAETALFEAFNLVKGVEDDRADVAQVLVDLAKLYADGGSPKEAERCYKHALRIRKRIYGDRSGPTEVILASLGGLFEMEGRWEEAERCLEEAFSIAEEAILQPTPSFFTILNNLARLRQSQGRWSEALSLINKAIAIAQDADTAPQFRVPLLYNRAEFLVALDQPQAAQESMREALAVDLRALFESSTFVSDSQELEILQRVHSRVGQFVSMCLVYLSDETSAWMACADLIVQTKTLGIDFHAIRRKAMLLSRDPSLRHLIDELDLLRSSIADKALAGPSGMNTDDWTRGLKAEELRCGEIEGELAKRIPEMALARQIESTGIAGIAAALPQGTALLEFFRYTRLDFKAIRSRGEQRYCEDRFLVLILPSVHHELFQLLDLGDADQIGGLISEFRSSITGESELDRSIPEGTASRHGRPLTRLVRRDQLQVEKKLASAVFDPLLPFIGEARQLVVSPDGELARLPFEVLPTGDGNALIDRYHISYVTAARDVLRFSRASLGQPSKSIVIAAPEFNLAERGDGTHNRAVVRRCFGALPGTAQEGARIAKLLGVKPFMGKRAVETVVTATASPRVLHLATHGFVIAPKQKKSLSPEDFTPGMVIQAVDTDRPLLALDCVISTPMAFVEASVKPGFERLIEVGLDNPLLRSGIALAGANTWLASGALPDKAGDGILTAEEVTGLDLIDTELVVLSACQTGLGEIRIGEGVFGFRRSFVLAGAATMVMSLWKVPDQPTAELMEDFYLRIIAGEGRADALRSAQLAMKSRYPEPYYWGAFICQGDPGPLQTTKWP